MGGELRTYGNGGLGSKDEGRVGRGQGGKEEEEEQKMMCDTRQAEDQPEGGNGKK